MNKEIFLSIAGYEDPYEVSNKGSVKSLRSGKLLSNKTLSAGYPCISLCNGKQVTKRIHNLVAEAFIPNPNKYPVINHIDGDKLNNCSSNLEWCSVKHNNQHSIDNGLKGKKSSPVDQFTLKGEFIRSFESQKQAEDVTGVCRKQINHCVMNKQKSAHGYVWRGKDAPFKDLETDNYLNPLNHEQTR